MRGGLCGVTKLIHNKEKDMIREQEDTEKVMIWLLTPPRNNLLGIYKLRRTEKENQRKGIDLIGTGFFKDITIENKTRYNDYGDLLIEIKSKKESNTWGWIEYCESDYLAYIIFEENKIQGSILRMPLLKIWWSSQDHEQYETYESKNIGYTTVNKAVPYRSIPKEIYVYSDYINL